MDTIQTKPKQIIFVGLQGSGKTTIVKELVTRFAEDEVALILADEIGRDLVTHNPHILIPMFSKYEHTIVEGCKVSTHLVLNGIMKNAVLREEFNNWQKKFILSVYNSKVSEIQQNPDSKTKYIFFECGPGLNHLGPGHYNKVIGFYVSRDVQRERLLRRERYTDNLIDYIQAQQTTHSLLEHCSDYLLDTSGLVEGSSAYNSRVDEIASKIKS